MSRIMTWFSLVLLLSSVNPARADFVLSLDPTTFVSNDVAPWVGTPFSQGGRYPTTNGLGIFSFDFTAVSVPFDQTLGTTTARALFIGVSSTPIPGDPRYPGGTASYLATARFEFGSTPVTGFGFHLLQASPGTRLRVFDVQNHVEDFVLSRPLGSNFPFVSVTSDVPISHFQISNSITDGTVILHVAEVRINAVPAPPSIVIAGMGLLCLGGFARRRATIVARSRAAIPPG